MALSLANLIDTKREDEGVWFQYGDTTFQVKLTFYGRKAMQEIAEAATKKRADPKNPRQIISEIDQDLFRDNWVPRVIKDWRGLTVKVLSQLIVLAEDPLQVEATEIPYSPADAMTLIKNSIVFDQWVTTMCSDVEAYNQAKKEDKLKNSSTAPATS